MKDSCKISVVVPVYNVEKYIGQCIESVQNQTFTEWELILVDDGSTDGSYDVCLAYAARDERVRLIRQLNQGVGSARNNGIHHAQGEYITFVDGDDFIADTMLECMYTAAQEKQANCVLSSLRYYYDETGATQDRILPDVTFDFETELNQYYQVISKELGFDSSCAKMYRMELIQRYGIRFTVEYSILEDYSFVAEYLGHCGKCTCVSEAFYHYRRHNESSLSKNFYVNAIDAMAYMHQKYEAFLRVFNEENRQHFYVSHLTRIGMFIGQIYHWKGLRYREKYQRLHKICIHDLTQEVVWSVPKWGLPLRKQLLAMLVRQKMYGVLHLIMCVGRFR